MPKDNFPDPLVGVEDEDNLDPVEKFVIVMVVIVVAAVLGSCGAAVYALVN